jgi:hypothetical protein
MYEDRFDLCTLQLKFIEEPCENQIEKHPWWKKLTLRKSIMMQSSCFSAISHFSMPVKRTKELRALTGWYVFMLSKPPLHPPWQAHIHLPAYSISMPFYGRFRRCLFLFCVLYLPSSLPGRYHWFDTLTCIWCWCSLGIWLWLWENIKARNNRRQIFYPQGLAWEKYWSSEL